MADIDETLAEIERALDGLGLDGVNVLTNVAGVYLGDASLEPIMEELNRRKAVVFIHPTSPACWECTSLGYPRPMIEFPFDTTRAVTNLLLSGTLARHPDIRWIVPHAGGTLPFLAPRIAGISMLLGADDPGAVVAQLRRLHYDLAGSANPPVVAALLGFVERSQVLYGSDWPFTPEQIVGAGLGWVHRQRQPDHTRRDERDSPSPVPTSGSLAGERSGHGVRRIGDLSTELPARLAAQPLDRATEADRGDHGSSSIAYCSADRGDAGLALLDALGDVVALQHTSRRSAIQRKQRTLRHDPTQPVRRLQRHDAAPTIAVCDVQLNTLAGRVAQRCENRSGHLGERELVLRRPTQADQLETRGRTGPADRGAPSPCDFERDRQPVGGRPRQPGLVLQRRQIERGTGERAKDENPFVNDADTAYTVH